jgi:hypothetical protein
VKVHEQLGDATTDEIVQKTLDIASSIWPVQTAEAEAWINQQLTNLGISYAKYQAQQAYESVSQYSGLLWIGGGLILLMLLRK